MTEIEQKTGLYRTLFEMSSMANNEEFVIHTSFPLRDPSEFEKSGDYQKYLREEIKLRWGAFSDPSPYFCREVLLVEIEAGLDVYYNGYLEKVWNKIPEVTRMIDGIYKMLLSVRRRVDRLGMDPVKALLLYISANYYDCIMSSGMPTSAILMARELILRHNIDRSLQISPKFAEPSEDIPIAGSNSGDDRDLAPKPEPRGILGDILEAETAKDLEEEISGGAWYTVQDFLDSTQDIKPIASMKLLPPGAFRLESEKV